MRIIDLSSDVCSSVLEAVHAVIVLEAGETLGEDEFRRWCRARLAGFKTPKSMEIVAALPRNPAGKVLRRAIRSEEHTSELQSLMRISYAVFCLKKKK